MAQKQRTIEIGLAPGVAQMKQAIAVLEERILSMQQNIQQAMLKAKQQLSVNSNRSAALQELKRKHLYEENLKRWQTSLAVLQDNLYAMDSMHGEGEMMQLLEEATATVKQSLQASSVTPSRVEELAEELSELRLGQKQLEETLGTMDLGVAADAEELQEELDQLLQQDNNMDHGIKHKDKGIDKASWKDEVMDGKEEAAKESRNDKALRQDKESQSVLLS